MYFSMSLSSSLGSEICMNYFILPNWLELNTVLNMIHVLHFHAARLVLVSNTQTIDYGVCHCGWVCGCGFVNNKLSTPLLLVVLGSVK